MTDDDKICGAVDDKGRTVFVCVLPEGHPAPRLVKSNGQTPVDHDTAGHYFRSLEAAS
jgi:hypothetical protein